MKKYLLPCISSTFSVMCALLCSNSVYAADEAQNVVCTPLDQQKVAALFDRWNDALKTKNPQKVSENYAPDAVLLPTLSNVIRTNHSEITDYFTYFLKANPVGKVERRVIRYGKDWATDTGLYSFEFTQKEGKKHVEARYSFVYECINGQWLIIQQHSSLMPEKNTDKNEN